MTRTFAPATPTGREIATICRDLFGSEPSGISVLRSGAWSSAVAVETDRGPMVLRFNATPDDFRADQLASRFATDDLPIPKVFGIGAIGKYWWCMSERMPGVHLDELDALQMARALPSLAAMLRRMRDAPSADTSGYGGWDENCNGRFGSFADQLLDVAKDNPAERGGGWSAKLKPHTHAQAVFDAGMNALDDLVAFIPPVRQLIHQDTLNFNVTVADDQISGIFDWGCAMWGDALYDLAWFRFWNPWYTQWTEVNIPDRLERTVGMQGDRAHERMKCYLLHIGMAHIRYNAFMENWSSMDDVVQATEAILREVSS